MFFVQSFFKKKTVILNACVLYNVLKSLDAFNSYTTMCVKEVLTHLIVKIVASYFIKRVNTSWTECIFI